MVIVVQFFTANQDAPGNNVGRGIRGLEATVAQAMPNTIDHARCPERNPDHLYGKDHQSNRTEQYHVQYGHQADTQCREAAVNAAL